MGLQTHALPQGGHHIWCRNGSHPAGQRHTAGIAYDSLLYPKPDSQACKVIRGIAASFLFQRVSKTQLAPKPMVGEEPGFIPIQRNPWRNPGWLPVFGE